MKTKRIKSKNKGVFFTKPRKVKEKLIKKTKEIEMTFKSKVEIPLEMYIRINADTLNKKATKGIIKHCMIEAVENGINTMLKDIKT